MASPLQPRTGQTRGGLPISINAPAGDALAPFVGRFFVTIIDQPATNTVEDILLNETGMVRVLVRGRWSGWQDERWEDRHDAVLFGAQARPQRVRCTGPMACAGFSIRPGGWFGIEEQAADAMADRFAQITGDWGAALTHAASDIDDHEGTIERLRAVVAARVAALGAAPDPMMEGFERLARIDPIRPVAAIADALEVSLPRLERHVPRYFGHRPKVVLRRSRFLDMAAVLRGMAIPSADALAAMRFYDQSHLIREFRHFTGMTPKQFEHAATPLMTPGIEVRQQRRLQELSALAPGERAPWMA